MHKDDHSQIYEMLSVLFLTLSKGEQVQQCIREVLTSHPLFSPLPLFKHIAKGSSTIKKEHLLSFIEENREQAEEEQVRNIMEYQPGMKAWQYKDFLQFVYPFNSAVLREVSHMHLKRYPKLEKYGVPESALAGFLLLLTQQVSLIRKLQTQKCDSWQKIPKQKLRKVLLSIKKAGEKQPSHCQNDQRRITSLELRNFMKAFVSVEDSHFLYLSRRLGIKDGFFLIEELQKFIKPNKKIKKSGKMSKAIVQPVSEGELDQDFDQKKYKQDILQELAHEVSDKKIKQTKYQQTHRDQKKVKQSMVKKPEPAVNNDNYFIQPKADTANRKVSSPKELFVKFIQVFLPASRRLEQLKQKLLQHKLDYFKLFKVIDRSGRGVIGAEDMMDYYKISGGRMHFELQDFQLLVQRYAQSEEPWITLTEFCEMVRAQDKEGAGKATPALGEQTHAIVIRIMEVSLESERQIVRIRRQFRRQEAKYLFSLINREQTGFINYQQLKKYLNQNNLQLSMHDLMSVLKRLDRSRNGVIVEHEFVSYFKPPEQY